MDKPRIVIKDFQQGTAPSPALGFQELRCLDITTYPGWVQPNYTLAKNSSTTVTTWASIAKQDSAGNTWWASESAIYKRAASNGAWTSVTGWQNGKAIKGFEVWTVPSSGSAFKDYLLVFVNDSDSIDLDIYDIAATAWTTGIAVGGSATGVITSFIAGNNIVYFSMGYGYGLGSLAVTAGQTFDETSSATYTLKGASSKALDFGDYVNVTAIAEIGARLAIGTERQDAITADVYMWDMTAISYDNKINIGGDGIVQLVGYNNNLYIQVRGESRWYISNGTSCEVFADFPRSLVNIPRASLFYRVHTAVVHRDLIYFGVGSNVTAGSGLGLYSLNPRTRAIVLEHVISTGEDGTNNLVYIGAIRPVDSDTVLVAWQDNDAGGTVYGVDAATTTRRTDSSSYFISPYYRANEHYTKQAFRSVEIQLARVMASGDSISIWYRSDQNGSWTTNGGGLIGTMSFSADGAVQAKVFPFAANVDSVQFKAALNGAVILTDITVR